MKKKNLMLLAFSGCLFTIGCMKPELSGKSTVVNERRTTGRTVIPVGYGSPLFVEEFNGAVYDTTLWYPRTGVRFNGKAVNDADNVQVGNGYLDILFKDDQGGNGVYSCGGLISRKLFGYGYYEAKVKLFTGSAGLHQSFWQMGTTTTSLIARDLLPKENMVLENDGLEAESRTGAGGSNRHSYVPAHVAQGGFSIGPFTTEFIVGYDWLPDRIDFYVNGVKKGTKYNVAPYNLYAQQQVWITAQFVPTYDGSTPSWYDFGGSTPLTDPNAKMQVDYIKYYGKLLAGTNLISNPSFEYVKTSNRNVPLQDPMCWIETRSLPGYDITASKVDSSADNKTGSYRLRHESAVDYLTTTKQQLHYIPNGIYKLTAWVKGSAHVSPSRMRVLGNGTTVSDLSIPATNTWTQITIDNIVVNTHTATIAFTSGAKAGEWIVVDDVVFAAK